MTDINVSVEYDETPNEKEGSKENEPSEDLGDIETKIDESDSLEIIEQTMPQQDAETNADVKVDETVLKAEDLSEKDSLESNTSENETRSVEVEYKETVEEISTEEES